MAMTLLRRDVDAKQAEARWSLLNRRLAPMPNSLSASPKLLDRLRVMHDAWKTEKACSLGRVILRFQRERNVVWKYPAELGKAEIEQSLTFLAVEEHVSPSTQYQPFSAILLLNKHILEIEQRLIVAGRAQRRQ